MESWKCVRHATAVEKNCSFDMRLEAPEQRGEAGVSAGPLMRLEFLTRFDAAAFYANMQLSTEINPSQKWGAQLLRKHVRTCMRIVPAIMCIESGLCHEDIILKIQPCSRSV